MSQHFYDRVATFENLGHRGAVTGWEVYDFVSLAEATRDLPIPSISTRTLQNFQFFSPPFFFFLADPFLPSSFTLLVLMIYSNTYDDDPLILVLPLPFLKNHIVTSQMRKSHPNLLKTTNKIIRLTIVPNINSPRYIYIHKVGHSLVTLCMQN